MAKKKATKGTAEEAISPPRKMGRPPSFTSVEDFEERAYRYLDDCLDVKPYPRVPNKAGLAVALGVTRTTLFEYESKPEYSNAIRDVYGRIEDEWIQRLARPHAAGTIFYLKNAYQYRDSIDHTTDGKPINFTVPNEIAKKHSLVFIETAKEEAK